MSYFFAGDVTHRIFWFARLLRFTGGLHGGGGGEGERRISLRT